MGLTGLKGTQRRNTHPSLGTRGCRREVWGDFLAQTRKPSESQKTRKRENEKQRIDRTFQAKHHWSKEIEVKTCHGSGWPPMGT